ncbi:MAG: hypothetical protein H7836_17210 [Magnetococcus sp. YQC-3]
MRMRPRRKMPKMGIKKKVALVKKANMKSDVHYHSRYVRAVDTTTLTTVASETSHTFTFRLSDVDNVTDYTNLFDNYRIIGVKLTFRLMTNPDSNNFLNSTVFTQGANFYPKLWYLKDYDDGNTLTVAQIRERAKAKCRILNPNRFVTIYVPYPRPLDEIVDNGGATTVIAANKPYWIKSDGVNTQHFGLKVALDKMGLAGNTMTIGIDRQYFFAFKNSR